MDAAKAVLRRNFTAINASFKKKKTSNNLNLHFIEPQKEQTKPKANKGRKE